MFDWKKLRIFCGVLLCLPLLQVAFQISNALSDYLDPSPEVWAEDLKDIIVADQARKVPERPLLVVGGQRVKLWKDLPAHLAPRDTLLRPLGDATIEDITYFYDRLIGFYSPSYLVIVPSYSDLHLRDIKSADELLDSIRVLVARNAEAVQRTLRVFVYVPIKMPLHPSDHEKIDEMAMKLKAWAESESNVTVLDVNEVLQMANGKPNPEFYRFDGINLNDSGYLRMSALLEAQL